MATLSSWFTEKLKKISRAKITNVYLQPVENTNYIKDDGTTVAYKNHPIVFIFGDQKQRSLLEDLSGAYIRVTFHEDDQNRTIAYIQYLNHTDITKEIHTTLKTIFDDKYIARAEHLAL